jgi:REP element-mobilizing transposase RayT
VFLDNDDRQSFIAGLDDCCQLTGWTCIAFCLMTNHYHLLVELAAPRLSDGMHLLNTMHAVRFNRRHERTGHVFDARFGSTTVDDAEHGEAVVRYIALNPVRAGLCKRPEDWPWSSYSAAAGYSPTVPGVEPDQALRWFEGDREAMVASVAAAIHRPPRPPLDDLLDGGTKEGILRARRIYGYSQKEIADFLGVSQPTVSRRIHGRE